MMEWLAAIASSHVSCLFLSFFLRGLDGFIVSYSKQSQLDLGSAGRVLVYLAICFNGSMYDVSK